MTPLKLIVALGALSAASHARAWDYVLLDSDKAAANWSITSQQLGVKTDKPFSVTLRTLHGGRHIGPSIRRRVYILSRPHHRSFLSPVSAPVWH